MVFPWLPFGHVQMDPQGIADKSSACGKSAKGCANCGGEWCRTGRLGRWLFWEKQTTWCDFPRTCFVGSRKSGVTKIAGGAGAVNSNTGAANAADAVATGGFCCLLGAWRRGGVVTWEVFFCGGDGFLVLSALLWEKVMFLVVFYFFQSLQSASLQTCTKAIVATGLPRTCVPCSVSDVWRSKVTYRPASFLGECYGWLPSSIGRLFQRLLCGRVSLRYLRVWTHSHNSLMFYLSAKRSCFVLWLILDSTPF